MNLLHRINTDNEIYKHKIYPQIVRNCDGVFKITPTSSGELRQLWTLFTYYTLIYKWVHFVNGECGETLCVCLPGVAIFPKFASKNLRNRNHGVASGGTAWGDKERRRLEVVGSQMSIRTNEQTIDYSISNKSEYVCMLNDMTWKYSMYQSYIFQGLYFCVYISGQNSLNVVGSIWYLIIYLFLSLFN